MRSYRGTQAGYVEGGLLSVVNEKRGDREATPSEFPAERWLRGGDLNPRPLGYEPNELPDCSTPRQMYENTGTSEWYHTSV